MAHVFVKDQLDRRYLDMQGNIYSVCLILKMDSGII